MNNGANVTNAMPSGKARYRYTCEFCGQVTEWFCEPIAVSPEKIKADLETDKAFMSYCKQGKSCPKCKKPQSWYNTYEALGMEAKGFLAIFGVLLGFSALFVVLIVSGFAIEFEKAIFPILWPNLKPNGFTFMLLACMIMIGAIVAFFTFCIQTIKKARQKALTASLPKTNKPEVEWIPE